MRKKGRKSWILGLAATSSTSRSIAASVLLVLVGCSSPKPPEAAPQAAAPPPTPAREAVSPLSDECSRTVKLAEKQGLIRPGTIDSNGAVILTDARWATRLTSDLQEGLARCVSHYIAGGQNQWLKRVQFRNQATGVVYATMEGDRFRIGE